MTAAERVLAHVKGSRRTRDGIYQALCPAHADRNPSLSIKESKDRVLLRCHAGCSTEAVCAAMGLGVKDLFDSGKENASRAPTSRIVATYPYHSESGEHLYDILRFEPKDFRPRQLDGTMGLDKDQRVLYRLPEMLSAPYLFFCEGERDVDNLRSIGLTATTSGSATSWLERYLGCFNRNHHVTILPHRDPPGQRLAQQVAAALSGKVASVKVLELPGVPSEGGDVSDWLQGKDPIDAAEELSILAENAPEWVPRAEAQSTDGDNDAYQDAKERLGAVVMADVQTEKVRWLSYPRIPLGKVTLMDGDPGLGKSFVTLALATAVTLGHGIPGEPPTEPGHVLLLGAEDGLSDTTRPRLDKMGADCRLITAISKPLTLDAEGFALLDTIMRSEKPRLVVIDPLFAYTGAKMDINRANETRAVMSQLADLAARHGCAIVCVRHLTKGGRDKSIYRGIGSIDLTAACRSVLLVGADASDPKRRAIVQIKNNLAPIAEPLGYSLVEGVFAWTGISDLTADDILASDTGSDEGPALLEEAVDFLRELLTGPMNQRDVKAAAKRAGVADRTLYRAKKKLGVKSEKIGFGSEGGWAWRLPE